MKKELVINDKIKEMSFINKINIPELDCLLRPLCLSVNGYEHAAVYYILFFIGLKYVEEEKFFSFIKSKTNIDIKWDTNCLNDFYKTINKLLSNDKCALIPVSAVHYNESDHIIQNDYIHFVLVKGYNSIKNEFLIIDENLYDKYDYYKDFTYYERWLSGEHLKYACSMIVNIPFVQNSYIRDFINKSPENQFLFVLIESTNGNKQCKIGDILSESKVHLNDIANQFEIIINNMKSSLNEILLRNDGYPELKDLYDFPKEVTLFIKFYQGYFVYQFIYNILMVNIEKYNDLSDLFFEMNNQLKKIKLLLQKFIFTHDKNNIDKVIENYLDNITTKMRDLNNQIIIFIEKHFNEIESILLNVLQDN